MLVEGLLLVASGLVWLFWMPDTRGRDGASGGEGTSTSWPRSPWKNARLDVAFVGDAACARCHDEIAESFRRHPMGRSLAPIDAAPAVGEGAAADGVTTFEAAGSRFTIEHRGGRVVHREARLDDKGRLLAQVEAVVRYALGSGAPPAPPRPAGSGLPVVLLNGNGLAPDETSSLEREFAIALAAEEPRPPATPGTRRIGSFALGVLDRVLSSRSDDLVARRMEAMALALAGRRDEAIRQVEMMLRARPAYEKALDECLSYAIVAGDVRTARAHARVAAALNPWSAAFHERLAFVSVDGRDWETAFRESSEALRIDPFLRFARMFLVKCFLHRREPGRAREEFETLVGLYPSLRAELERWFDEQRRRVGE